VLLDLAAMGPLAFLGIGLVIATVTGIALPAASSGALGANHDATGASAGLLNFSIYGVGALSRRWSARASTPERRPWPPCRW